MANLVESLPRDLWTLVHTEDDRMRVLDLAIGRNTTVSSTELRPGQQTRGHDHDYPEVLVCIGGWWHLLTGTEDEPDRIALNVGTAVLIEPSEWHRVEAPAAPITFLTIFEGDRRRATYRGTR